MRLPNGQEYYDLPRELYSVAALTDETGAIVEAATYDTYGQVAVYNGAGQPVGASPIGNPYYFTGRRLDLLPTASSSPRRVAGGDPQPVAKQVCHYRARAYDPGNGRFLQRDPSGYRDGGCLLEYALSEPVLYVDPQRLESESAVSTSQPVEPRPRTPGTFDITISDTERKGISSTADIRYTPTDQQKRCCNNIRMIQVVETEVQRTGWDINEPPHLDAPKKGKEGKDEQPWPFYPYQVPGGCDGKFAKGKGKGECELEDDPGCEGEVKKLSQSFETCAVCTKGGLKAVNFGCRKWGHYKLKGQPLQRWGAGYALTPNEPSPTFLRVLADNGNLDLDYAYPK